MSAAPNPAHTDEAKVPPYTLPNPLVMADGSPVRDAAAWRARRRPELLELFAREVYGRTPAGRPAAMRAEVTSVDRAALGGKATRKEITLWFTGKTDGPRMNLLLYVPNHVTTPPPVFLGLNFFGNHTVHADPGIALAQPHTIYDTQRYRPVDPQPEKKPEQRGAHAERWQVETVIAPTWDFWGGVGEPTICVTAPAVMNAIAAAIGLCASMTSQPWARWATSHAE
jgi:hypothetical protein